MNELLANFLAIICKVYYNEQPWQLFGTPHLFSLQVQCLFLTNSFNKRLKYFNNGVDNTSGRFFPPAFLFWSTLVNFWKQWLELNC